MNGLGLLPLFVLACIGGYVAARPGVDPGRPFWRAGVAGPVVVILVGALIAAAETLSTMARYLALVAVLASSAAAVMMLGIMERRWPPVHDDADDGDDP